jgi:hypothetical protein
MIKIEEVCNLIEKFNTPCIKICDLHNNTIMRFEDCSDASDCVAQLRAFESVLSNYGKVIIFAGNAKQAEASYRHAFKWSVLTAPEGAKNITPQVATNFSAPHGYIHQDIMALKLEAIQKEIKHERELRELKEAQKDATGFEKYIPFIPAVMAGLGWGDDKIERMMKYGAQGKAMGATIGWNKTEATNTLTFKDVEKMTPEEQVKKIQDLLDSLSTKVSAEHMILLLSAIDKKPELAEKAVNFLPML